MDCDQLNKMTQSCHLSPLSERSVGEVPVVGPIWRGGIEIRGKVSKKLDGLEVFMPKILNPKVDELKRRLQKSVCFRMKSRRALWPKHFDDVGAAHSDIELFMLPEVSRSEVDYGDLVEQMISNDLAMTSHIGNFKLIIFTSLELEDNQQYKQGKYYLWGILKGKGLKRCKSSKGRNTNAETLDCAKKSNSPSSGRSAPSVGHLPITTTQSAVRYDFVPSLCQEFKRPRSKRGRISRMLKEVGDVHKSVVADFPAMERIDKETYGGVPVQWQQTLGKSWQAKICTNIGHVQVANDPDITVMKKKPFMVTDEEDDLSKKDAVTSVVDDVELQVQSNVSQALGPEIIKACLTPFLKSEELPVQEVPNPVIDETRASLSDKNPERILCHTVNVTNQKNSENVILILDEDSTSDGPTVAVPMVRTDSKNRSCLIPLLHYKEGLDLHEPDPSTSGETISRLDEKPLVNASSSVVDDQKRTELQDTMPGISEFSVGRCQLGDRVDQLECQASDPLPQMDACRTPVLTSEEPGPCLSSSSTLVLEVDEEEDEEETAMKGTEIFNEGRDMITTTSMLNIADHFLEESSDTLRTKVGEYMIKSDLAPILTKILFKYGDIGLNCSMMPEPVLEKICKALQDLEQVSLKDLRRHLLDDLRILCKLGETSEINMKWLYDRCEDLEKTVLQISQYGFLKKELVQCNNSINSLEEKVELNRSIVDKLHEENKLIEKEDESLIEHQEKLRCEIEDVRFQSRRFTGKSLVDGLF